MILPCGDHPAETAAVRLIREAVGVGVIPHALPKNFVDFCFDLVVVLMLVEAEVSYGFSEAFDAVLKIGLCQRVNRVLDSVSWKDHRVIAAYEGTIQLVTFQ